jgi:DNA mismatch repair protein MutL
MASIQVLDSEIINQIAAGEVVERPAHLVKELVENSLDAQATEIQIDISLGGKYIRIKDNGEGILSNELESALKRHATSKITKTADLWNLNSFGFRGEALASAAAVSKLSLKSSEKNEKKPSQIQSDFGKVSAVKPSAAMTGTEITIDSLFENVPARLKFLKSDSTENQQIKVVIKALALAHPSVEFKLLIDQELELFYPVRKSHFERAQDVFEKKDLFEVYSERGDWKCRAVFSSPHEVAKTSKQIWIFAQNRWIQDRALQAAIMDAYRSLLMHGEYPFVALWLECEPSLIDVNIHPTKSQVKFQDSSTAFRTVQGTLRAALEKAPWLSSYQKQFETQKPLLTEPAYQQQQFSQVPGFQDHSFQETRFKNKSFDLQSLQNLKVESPTKVSADLQTYQSFVTSAAAVSQKPWSSLQVIGQVNLTYIVCQKEDRLVLVDQHAAHERVVFESLMQSWKENRFERQDYLFPLAIDLTEDKVEALVKHQDDIRRLGFEIEQLGPQVLGVKSAPHLVKDSSLPSVFEKLANDLVSYGGSFAIEKKISDLFASMACHSVIRAGQSLSREEMIELLKSMDQFALSSFCPHGRPVSVDLTFHELEKLFGRIN